MNGKHFISAKTILKKNLSILARVPVRLVLYQRIIFVLHFQHKTDLQATVPLPCDRLQCREEQVDDRIYNCYRTAKVNDFIFVGTTECVSIKCSSSWRILRERSSFITSLLKSILAMIATSLDRRP
jgi:hypothetical protein